MAAEEEDERVAHFRIDLAGEVLVEHDFVAGNRDNIPVEVAQ